MNPSNNHSEPVSTLPSRSLEHCSSAAEVREFLDNYKGRDPEEVLGTDSSRGLAIAIGQATVITVVLMVVLTAGSSLWTMLIGGNPAVNLPVDKNAKVETPEPAKTPATPTTAPTTAPTAKNTPTTGKDFIDKIGANDSKQANPKVNPLDKSTDDLFKDLDKK